MRRGEISNIGSYEVWVDARFIYEVESQLWWERIFPTKYRMKKDVKKWLNHISRNVRPVLVWIEKPLFDESICELFCESRVFETFDDCLDAMRAEEMVVELVTEDTAIISEYVVLWDRNKQRYGRREIWTTSGPLYRK